MSAMLEKIRRDAQALPAEEQRLLGVELIEMAWGAYEPEKEVEAAWDEELKKRAEDIRAGRVSTMPWEEVRRDLARTMGWED